MIVRSFGNHFEVQDYTEEMSVIPNQWGTINELGIFHSEPVREHVVVFEETIKDGAIIVDRIRGERSNVGRDAQRKIHSFAIPHFPLDDAIYPQDIQGQRAYGKLSEAETFDAVRMRKMERIRQNHAWTLEFARAQAIVAGTAYAPSGTISQDWYTSFTGSARPAGVDFTLGTSGTELLAKIETVIATMQDSYGSLSMNGVVALCSSQFFSALIAHASIKQAYQYYSSTQEPLRQRQAAGGSAVPLRREFFHGGVRFIEMRDQYNGVKLIPNGDAYFVPTGTDYFKTYFSPANRFGTVNTLGEEVYYFESAAPNGTAYNIETESNHVSALLKPLLVIRGFSSN